MTVIAYSTKTKIMASDSRCSNEHEMHLTNIKKIFRLKNGALLGTSGGDDDREVRDLLGRATPRRMPTRTALSNLRADFSGILVFKKGQVFLVQIEYTNYDMEDADYEWNGSITPITDEVVAVGSGHQYAYGALDGGKSPIDAVRCACKRDLKCALPVQWETL